MRYFIAILLVSILGCSDDETSNADNAGTDAAVSDAGGVEDMSGSDTLDASQPIDMSADSGAADDAGSASDSGAVDSGAADASQDMGNADAAQDMASADASQSDAATPDASTPDASTPDMPAGFECPPPKFKGGICTQVIVWVRDQDSGMCCRYPTPCHIPDGDWGNETYGSESQCRTI